MQRCASGAAYEHQTYIKSPKRTNRCNRCTMESSTVSKSQTATVDSSAIDEDATGSYQHPDGSQEPRSEGISDSLEEDFGPDAEELADHAIIVEELWDVLEGYGMVKPNSTRPVPQAKPDPTEDVKNDLYAEGYSAENFVVPESEEESGLTDKKLLDELPGMLETIDDLVDVKVHELCEILYHSTNWNDAQPILDAIAVNYGDSRFVVVPNCLFI